MGHLDDSPGDEQTRITEVQERYTEYLMRKANVVGVAVGLRKQGGVYTNHFCLVVMVDRKVPLDQLAPEDRIPTVLDGIPVDVQETGSFTAF